MELSPLNANEDHSGVASPSAVKSLAGREVRKLAKPRLPIHTSSKIRVYHLPHRLQAPDAMSMLAALSGTNQTLAALP